MEQEAVPDEDKAMMAAVLADYAKLVEEPELADVVLVVEGERFPAHRNVLTARSEYFRGLCCRGCKRGEGRRGG